MIFVKALPDPTREFCILCEHGDCKGHTLIAYRNGVKLD